MYTIIIAKIVGAMTQYARYAISRLFSHLSSMSNHEMRLKNLGHKMLALDIR